MISLALLQSAYALGAATVAKDWESYKPYRECVLSRAAMYAKTGESVAVIKDAAYADCRGQKSDAGMDILKRGLDLANSRKDGSAIDAPTGSAHNIDEFDKALDQDLASLVLRTRVK